MPASAREIERKYDVAPDFALPELSAFADHVDGDLVQLSSSYYDTAKRDLLRYRLALRQRAGDTDTGWQLKLPDHGERTELRWPTADTPPDELLRLLRPFLGDQPLAPSVRLDVARRRRRLMAGSGELLAEVALDDVRATGLAGPVRARRWHEAEIELGPAGSPELLASLGAALRAQGAVASTSRAKLARAVAGIGNEGVGTPRTSAGAVLIDYISQQCDALVAGHFAVKRDLYDSVHRTRVACRRMRSTLRSFEYCFDAEQAAAFEDELKWYASVLGGVRDLEVLRAHLATAIAELPPELVLGPVAETIDKHLGSQYAERQVELFDVMDGERYARLLAEAMRWRDDPPFTAAAGRPAGTLHDTLMHIERQLDKRLAKASRKVSTDTQMHRARKAGKRVRYAAEAVTIAGDLDAPRIAKAITKVQDALGEFQDSVVAAQVLRRLADEAGERGENAFTYGVLVAEERQRGEDARRHTRDLTGMVSADSPRGRGPHG